MPFAFILAALIATRDYLSRPAQSRGLAEALLIGLVYVIGVGSFLFHTYSTRWASVADTAPIGIFMLAYLTYALRKFLGRSWAWILLVLLVFVAARRSVDSIPCAPELLPITAQAGKRCLNGTLFYAPALIAMGLVSASLLLARHAAWRYLAAATMLFLVSMTFRTLDIELCDFTRIGGHVVGVHFLWHMLNAAMLYLLLAAAIRYGGAMREAPAEGEAREAVRAPIL